MLGVLGGATSAKTAQTPVVLDVLPQSPPAQVARTTGVLVVLGVLMEHNEQMCRLC